MSGSSVPRSEGFEHHPYAPQVDFLDNTVTNQARPLTSAIITVRIIKNFEFRTMKPLVLRDIDLTKCTTPQLIERCRHEVRTQPAFKAYRNVVDDLGTYNNIRNLTNVQILSNFIHRHMGPRRRT